MEIIEKRSLAENKLFFIIANEKEENLKADGFQMFSAQLFRTDLGYAVKYEFGHERTDRTSGIVSVSYHRGMVSTTGEFRPYALAKLARWFEVHG